RQEQNAASFHADFPGRQLTLRERQVLAEIAAASSNKEAAAHLGLSPRTIEVHRAHIMMKLGTKNTADLVRLVMNNAKAN
ncbi:MAG: LuxR C-terminal-related transcriptional regulator, partial [Methylovirgula sp.]